MQLKRLWFNIFHLDYVHTNSQGISIRDQAFCQRTSSIDEFTLPPVPHSLLALHLYASRSSSIASSVEEAMLTMMSGFI